MGLYDTSLDDNNANGVFGERRGGTNEFNQELNKIYIHGVQGGMQINSV